MSGTALITNRVRWTGVAMLTALYTLNAVDRYVIAVVIEPIRHEFGLTDTELGAVSGLGHALAFSACVLPVGWLLDRYNRVKLLSAMLGFWSVMTATGAACTGFWSLFLMRMGVGAGESAGAPGTQSLLASLFPLKSRASAMGVVFSGTAIGTGLIFAVGAPVAATWGWRWVFLLAGVPGLLLAALMWFRFPEPPRSAENRAVAAAVPMRHVVSLFVRTPPMWLTCLGTTIAGMNVVTVWVWITPVLIRQQGFSLAEAGMVVGLAAGGMKFVSGFLSGFLGDWIAKGRLDRLWIVPSVALALSAPICFAIAVSPSHWVTVALVMCLGLTLGTHYAAPRTVLMTVTPENMRGSVASLEQLMVNLIGVALGPVITGMISDYMGGDVGMALSATVSLNVLAALVYWLGARRAEPIAERIAGPVSAAAVPVEG